MTRHIRLIAAVVLARVAIWLLARIQQRCPHHPSWVLADFAEGQCRGTQIRWCRVCGAIAVACCDGDQPRMRAPEPEWVTAGWRITQALRDTEER